MLTTETSDGEEDETEDEELEEQPAEEPTTQLHAVVPSVEAQLAPPRVRKIDFVSRRNWYFLFSLLIIIPGIFFMVHSGFKLGIDFAGGTEFTVNFNSKPSQAQVESAVAADLAGGSVISTGNGGYIIRTPPLTPAQQKNFEDQLQRQLATYNLQ